MGRPSDLLIDVDPRSPRVRVTGQAVPIGREPSQSRESLPR
jgi:hypothetical protein